MSPEAVVVVDVIGVGMTMNAIHYGTILMVEVLLIIIRVEEEREEEEEELEVLLLDLLHDEKFFN